MAPENDIGELEKAFDAFEENARLHLDHVPAGAVKDNVKSSIDHLRAEFTEMVAAFRQEQARADQGKATAQAKIAAARKEIAAIGAKSQVPKAAAAAAPPPAIVSATALHARLRDLLLGPPAPTAAPQGVPVDEGSVADYLSAFVEPEAAPAMSVPASLPLLPQGPARPLAEGANLSDRARALLEPNATVEGYIGRLGESGLLRDVMAFLTAALATREAVWWVSLCLQRRAAPRSAAVTAAFRAAVAWVLDPTALCRQEALKAGEALGSDDPYGCLALAAGQTPGPLTTPPSPGTSGEKYLLRALGLALAPRGQVDVQDLRELFVQLGLGVAAGDLTWKKLVAPKGSAGRRPPDVPAGRPDDMNNGHNLGKRLLIELGLVADPSASRSEAEVDDEGFRWESSDTWNSLGM